MPRSRWIIAGLFLVGGLPLAEAQFVRPGESAGSRSVPSKSAPPKSTPPKTAAFRDRAPIGAANDGATAPQSFEELFRPTAYQGQQPETERNPADNSTPRDHSARHDTLPVRAASDPDREIGRRELSKPGAKSGPPSGEKPRSTGVLVTTIASLAVVIGVFLLVMWFVRRQLPRGMSQLPNDVWEVLGRTSLGPRQPAMLVRLGDRLLLVATHAGEMRTLCEINDPDEVTRLVGLCHQAQPQSATAAFRHVLQQLGKPTRAGGGSP